MIAMEQCAMSTDNVIVEAECPACGGFLETPDNPTDSSPVTCSLCGRSLGTYGELKRQAIGAAEDKGGSVAIAISELHGSPGPD
jgi:hypothetical protein